MPRASKQRYRKNYTALLSEIQGNAHINTIKAPAHSYLKPEKEIVSEERRRRDRLMGNRQLRYVYSAEDGVFHDRDCSLVSQISDKDFHMLSEFRTDMVWCPVCVYRALVRSAIGDDVRYIDAYVGVLKRFGARLVDLQELFVANKARLCGVEIDRIYIEVHEDMWLLCKEENALRLYHNNYEIIGDYERLFHEGFHLQVNEYAHSFRYYVNLMCDYSWEEHVKRYREQALREKRTALFARLLEVDNAMRLKGKNLFYHKYRMLSWREQALCCCEKEGVKLKLWEKEYIGDGYVLFGCKVRKRQAAAFMRAMNALKGQCVEDGCWDYGEMCERYIEQQA